MPDLNFIGYNFDTNQLEWSDGARIEPDELRSIVKRANDRIASVYDTKYPEADRSEGDRAPKVGRATVKRAAIIASLVRSESGERPRILGLIVRESNKYLTDAKEAFYSEDHSHSLIGPIVAELKGDEINIDSPFESAKVYYKNNLQGTLAKSEAGTVRFSSNGWNKVKNGLKKNYLKAQIIPAIKDIIENGYYLGRESLYKDRSDNIVAFHNFEGIVKIGNDDIVARVAVGEDSDGNLFYDINRNKGDIDTPVKKPGQSYQCLPP